MTAAGPIPVLYLHHRGEISGGEISLLALWEQLDRQRFQPVLAGPAAGELAVRAQRLGVVVFPLSLPRIRGLAGPRLVSALRSLRAIIQSSRAALLHGNAPITNLLAGLAGRPLGCRVIWHERTLPEPGMRDLDRLLRFLPHRIICNSGAVARRFGGAGRRVVVIHNGVALRAFHPGCGGAAARERLGLSAGQVAIGLVGNFSPVKRHELFLEAAAALAPELPHATFLVVGGEVFPENRGREARLRAACASLGLQRRVRFLGAWGDMPALYDGLDILVSAADREACSRAVLEAMATGTPVVAADAGGNPELVASGESGLLFPAGNAPELAAALGRLVRAPELRRALGVGARRRAEAHFSLERQLRETEACYAAELAAARPRPAAGARPGRMAEGGGVE